MHIAAIVALTVIAAIIIIFFFYQIIRLKFEKQFRDWQEEELVKWKSELANSRREAVTQSRAILGGKFTEQMVPYFPDFAYDPTEVRFIGTPIDLIVFPGLAQGDPREIVILEIKTGKNPQLTPAQKKIRQLIEDGMVRWEEIYRSVEGD